MKQQIKITTPKEKTKNNSRISCKRQIIFIVLSGIILSFSVRDFGYIFISIPLFLVLSYNLTEIVLNYINHQKSKIKKNIDIEWIGVMGVLISIFPAYYFENTIGGYNLFWISAFLSIPLNILLVVILNGFIDFTNKKKLYNVLSVCIFTFVLIPSLSAFINAKISNEPTKSIKQK